MDLKGTRLPLITFIASVVAFGAITLYSYEGHGRAFARAALPFNYIALAAATAWYWKSGPRENSSLPSFKRPAMIAAAASVLIAAGISFSMQPITMLPDENVYRFQSRIYASGRLVADPLPGAAKTNIKTPPYLYFLHHVLTPHSWYGKYSPGWPLVLAFGDLIHAGWLMNPLLALLLLYLSGQIALAFYGDRVRWLTILLMACSSYFFTHAYTELSHMLCAVLTAGATLLIIRWIEHEKLVFLIAALVCIGVNFQVRPFSALAVAIGLCGGLLQYHRSQRRLLFIDLAVITTSGVVAIAAFLSYQYLYTGNALLSPYAVSQGRTVPGELQFATRYFINGAIRYRQQIQDTLIAVFPCFGWFLIAGILNPTGRPARFPSFARAVMLLYPIFMLIHITEPEPSFGSNGERYYFEAFFTLAILAARGIEGVALRWQAPAHRVVVSVLAFAAVMVPIIAASTREPLSKTMPYHRMAQTLEPLSKSQGEPTVVFMTTSPHFKAHFFNPNAADWRRAPAVFIGDPGVELREGVVRSFGRSHWMVAHYDEDRQVPVLTEGGTLPVTSPPPRPSAN